MKTILGTLVLTLAMTSTAAAQYRKLPGVTIQNPQLVKPVTPAICLPTVNPNHNHGLAIPGAAGPGAAAQLRYPLTITPIHRCPILVPDLTITDMGGFGTMAAVTVMNIGQTKSKTVALELKVSVPVGPSYALTLVRYAMVPPLAPGESTIVQINTGSVLMTSGVRLDGFVDSGYALGELDELNNRAGTVLGTTIAVLSTYK